MADSDGAGDYQQHYIRIDDRLPDPGVRVIVVCRGSRCLGYLDDDAMWRGHYGDRKLEDVIGWMP